MYMKLGRYDAFIGKDYVIHSEKKLFSGLSIEAGINGGKEYEFLFMGYLFQLSISSHPSVINPPVPDTY